MRRELREAAAPSIHCGGPPCILTVQQSQGKGVDGEELNPPKQVYGRKSRGKRQSEMLEPRDEGEDAIRGGAGVCALERGRGEEERWVMTKVIEHFLARLPPEYPGRWPSSELNLNKLLLQPSA